MNQLFKKLTVGVSALLAGAFVSSPVLGDDTEVYFGGTTPSNILLVLDESGSMAWDTVQAQAHSYFYYDGGDFPEKVHDYDYLQWYSFDYRRWYRYTSNNNPPRGYYYRWAHNGSGVSRMSVLKEAAKIFINDLEENTRVGIMSYTTGKILLRQEVRPMSDSYGGRTHKARLLTTIDDLSPDSGTPTAGALLKGAEYFRGELSKPGGGRYVSPITDTCSLSNNMILLSDGEPNTFYNSYENDIEDMIGKNSCRGTFDGNGNASIGNDVAGDGHDDGDDDGERCSMDLAGYLANNKQLNNVDESQVITSTIAFALANQRAQQFLKDVAGKAKHVAEDGTVLAQGNYAEATDVDSLVEAFKASISSTVDTGSLVAPSVPLSQSNRLRSGNEVFLAMFRPLSNNYWPGNLKKYYLKEGKIHSEDTSKPNNIGDKAVNENTGAFFPSASSAWTSFTDGDNMLKGGAAQDLEGFSTPVYSNLFSDDLSGNDKNILDVGTTADLSDSQIQELYGPGTTESDSIDYTAWLAAKSITMPIDYDGDGDREETTLERFGDPLHSQPIVVPYDEFSSRTVYIATNQGFLHAVNPDTGKLRWSFMPKELMRNVPDWKSNLPLASADNRNYGLDGDITISVVDNDRDGKIEPADGDSRTLYVGQRRGGYEYYALDVTSPDSPKLKFTVRSGSSQQMSKFYNDEKVTILPNLGQTWSKPLVAKVKWQGVERRVLFFGGGYDPKHDNPNYAVNTSGQMGNTIYALDADTGKPLTGFATKIASAGITNAVPADLTIIDLDNNGLADTIYAADVGGKVYRVDLPKKDDNSDFSAGLIGDINSGGSNRRFYNKPDVVFTNFAGQQFGLVAIGSGYRAHPKNEDTTDRMYVFYDKYVNSRKYPQGGIVESELKDVTTKGAEGFASIADIYPNYEGWYITLPKGEKVLSDTTTINYRSFFTTYSPGTAEDVCSPATGANKLYGINILDGAPIIDRFNNNDGTLDGFDRHTELDYVGIAPGITLLFPDNTSAAALVGTETIGAGDDWAEELGLKDTLTTIKWKQDK